MNHLRKPCIKYGEKQSIRTLIHIGRSFKCILEVGVEESIVNAPHVSFKVRANPLRGNSKELILEVDGQ
jgi:hypothetical protein